MYTEIQQLLKKSKLLNGLAAIILLMGIAISLFRYDNQVKKQVEYIFIEDKWIRKSLNPNENPNPNSKVQPNRLKPNRIIISNKNNRAYVTLSGKEINPGTEVAIIDIDKGKELERIKVGSGPAGITLHPSGQWALVTNRFSNFISVIDLKY